MNRNTILLKIDNFKPSTTRNSPKDTLDLYLNYNLKLNTFSTKLISSNKHVILYKSKVLIIDKNFEKPAPPTSSSSSGGGSDEKLGKLAGDYVRESIDDEVPIFLQTSSAKEKI
jgi:hypothetical protein